MNFMIFGYFHSFDDIFVIYDQLSWWFINKGSIVARYSRFALVVAISGLWLDVSMHPRNRQWLITTLILKSLGNKWVYKLHWLVHSIMFYHVRIMLYPPIFTNIHHKPNRLIHWTTKNAPHQGHRGFLGMMSGYQ